MSLGVLVWKWRPVQGYRSSYSPAQVHAMRDMVRRWYDKPHTFTCVTDDPTGLDADIRIVPLPNDFSSLQNPHGPKNPSCYRRLRMFAPDAADLFGPRFVSLDLDCVVTGDLSPLFDRPEPFVMYGDTNPKTHYNGSLMLMTAGSRTQVWETFDPATSPRAARSAGHFGSDQAWISHCLGGKEAKFGRRDGVYSYRNDLRASGTLPSDARLVVFHGNCDPWGHRAQQIDWVRRFYGVVSAAA